jgi:hypothetical protein
MSRLTTIFLIILIATLTQFSCASDEEKKVAHFNKGLAYFEEGEYKSARLEFKNRSLLNWSRKISTPSLNWPLF